MLPTTAADTEGSSTVLENIGRGSTESLKPLFYEFFMSEKLTRDYESKAMLDIIFSIKYYDLDDFSNLSGFNGIIVKIAKVKT